MTTAALPSSSDLVFEPLTHSYSLPDGRLVPSVTTIIKAVGVSADFDEIAGFSAKLGEQIEMRRALGTAVHQDAHAFDDDDLDWSTVDPRVKPYVEAWATFRVNSGLRPVTRERMVFHPIAFYCGTLDGIFETPGGLRVLVDLKIGDPQDAGCAYQTAAYQAAYAIEHPDEPITLRWGVQLTPDRQIPYRITPYADWQDYPKFQAFVTTYHEQAERRRGR